MERNFNMKIGIPKEVVDLLKITEDTVFEVYFENGYLSVRALSEAESKEIMHGVGLDGEEEYDSFDEAYESGLNDGHVDGYEAGYRRGYSHCLDGKPYAQEYPGDEVLNEDRECQEEDCDECEYYCPHCGKCRLEESTR